MSMSRRMAVVATLLLAGLLACGAPPSPEPLHTGSVNLVLGDASFQARFGRPPSVHDDEDLRIRVHLEHVLGLLRQRPTERLSAAARAARTRHLERLAAYIRRGEFTLVDQLDRRGHLSLGTGLLFDGRGDGVPFQLDLSMAAVGESGLGPYANISLTKLTGAARAASALSNLDAGVAAVGSLFSGNSWLVLRGGLLLPTGDEDEVGAALNDAMAARRPAQAVLFQPGSLGVRLSASTILLSALCDSCSFRLDAGLDGYSPFDRDFQLSPRWGAGFAYLFRPFLATLEVAGARYAEVSSASSRFHHSVGGSFRFISESFTMQPGVSVSVPLEGRLERAFVGFDLTLRK